MDALKSWWRKKRNKLYGPLALPLAKMILSTVKFTVYHEERLTELDHPAILCGLHAHGLVTCWSLRNRGYWVMVSLSRDGELQHAFYSKLGFKTIRGSGGRGGLKAALEAIKILKGSRERLVVAADGSKGPRGIVQEGILMIARKSGAALVPGGLSACPRWSLKTWDRFSVPKPFSKVAAVTGEPIFVPADATPEEIETIRQQLEDAIHALEEEADRIVGYTPKPDEKREAVPSKS